MNRTHLFQRNMDPSDLDSEDITTLLKGGCILCHGHGWGWSDCPCCEDKPDCWCQKKYISFALKVDLNSLIEKERKQQIGKENLLKSEIQDNSGDK